MGTGIVSSIDILPIVPTAKAWHYFMSEREANEIVDIVVTNYA